MNRLNIVGANGTISWSSPADRNKVGPGIDRGGVFALGSALLIWGDASGGAGGSGSIGSRGAEGNGYLAMDDGRRVVFSYATKDGKTGRVTLDGVDYDLAKGNVFLVAAEGERDRVKQLGRDLGRLKLEPEFFKSFARSDPEISGFFAGEEERHR